MKKLLKVLISLFVLSMLSTNVYADSEYIAESVCGENIQWYLDEQGTLTLTGSGKMYDWVDDNEKENQRPTWNGYADQVKRVVIGYGIENLGNYAFYCHKNLESVEIPNSVTSIGKGAFYSCDNLLNVEIPNSVTEIGNYGFFSCNKLTEIKIPDSVKTIGSNSFAYCYDITELTIPSNVTEIGNEAFETCTKLKSVTIDDNISSWGKYIFYRCEELEYVNLPKNMTYIPTGMFTHCKKLAGIKIPDTVVSIDKEAFNGSGLEKVVLPQNVRWIEYGAFFGCDSLTRIVIDDAVISIEQNAFGTFGARTRHFYYTGTEEQWEDININANLKKYVMSDVTYQYKETVTEYTLLEDGIQIDVKTVGNYPETAKIIVAGYSNGILSAVEMRSVDCTEKTVFSDTETDEIKVFAWDALSEPLTTAEEIALTA